MGLLEGSSSELFSEEPVGKSKDCADSMPLYFICKRFVSVGKLDSVPRMTDTSASGGPLEAWRTVPTGSCVHESQKKRTKGSGTFTEQAVKSDYGVRTAGRVVAGILLYFR